MAHRFALREALRNVDIFLPNEREASLMTGETRTARILDAFRKMGMTTVALKLGARGAALLNATKNYFWRPSEVASDRYHRRG